MPPTVKEVVITKKCRVEGEHKEPGEHVEVTVEDANYLVGLERATFDLKWTPPAEADPKGKGKGKGKE